MTLPYGDNQARVMLTTVKGHGIKLVRW